MASAAHRLDNECPRIRNSSGDGEVENLSPHPHDRLTICRFETIGRSFLLSAFVLFSSIIGGPPKSLAAAGDAASVVSDLGSRAIAAMQSADTASARQGQFRQLFRQYFDGEACARAALGPHWEKVTAEQRQEYVERFEDYVVISYSLDLGDLGGESFTVLGSQPDKEGLIVTTLMNRTNGAAPIRFDWQLNLTNAGYKVTNVIVSGINMASIQRADLVSVIQRNDGHVQALLAALREKNASNGILR